MKHASGDVVLVDFGATVAGREQIGIRPSIFLSEEGGVSLIVPLTSNLGRLKFAGTARIEPDSTNKLAKTSVALVFQLGAIDSRRLVHHIGTLSTKDRRALNRVLRSITLIK